MNLVSDRICKELFYYCDKIRSTCIQLSSTSRSPDGRCRGARVGPEQAAPVGTAHQWLPAGFLTAPMLLAFLEGSLLSRGPWGASVTGF